MVRARLAAGVFFALVSGSVWAADEVKLAMADTDNSKSEEPEKVETQLNPSLSKKMDSKTREHLMQNIYVFGKSEMPAIYILTPGIEEYEGFLLTRDFSRDEFFMQNIDREEFEMKTYMREFSESTVGSEEAKKKMEEVR